MMHDSVPGRNVVIGANSFIGSHLLYSLKSTSPVIGVYHKNTNNLLTDVINVPLSQLNTINGPVDNVYIIGAYIPKSSGLTNVERKEMFEANVLLTEQICSQFQSSKIIYCSSVSVYRPKDQVISENDNEGGMNEYGVSKLWGEHIISQMPRYAIVRCSSVYGRRMNLSTIIPNYIRQALNQNKITVFGSGSRQQNYIHVSDVVGLLQSAAVHSNNNKFLATSLESISNKTLAELIIKDTGGDVHFEKEDHSASFFYNNRQTIEQLNYHPKVNIEEGIKEIIQWIKEVS